MGKISRSESVTTSTSSVQAAPARHNRVGIYISNTGTGDITISKGESAAVAGAGIVLKPTYTWYEVDSGEGFRCWRGPIQIIDTGNGTAAVSEDMDV